MLIVDGDDSKIDMVSAVTLLVSFAHYVVTLNVVLAAGLNLRVLEGEEATEEDFPYLARITHNYKDADAICCGVILDKDWVLTAGRCAYEMLGREGDTRKLEVEEYGDLVAGTLSRTIQSKGEQRRKVKGVVVHPWYNPQTLSYPDLALLKVDKPFDFDSSNVGPFVPLNSEVPETDKVCLIPGWGGEEIYQIGEYLKKTPVTVMDSKKCRKIYDEHQTFVPPGYLCGIGDRESGMCWAGFGCPLICDGNVAGIASSSGAGCGDEEHPGVFVDVWKYKDWIEKVLYPKVSVDLEPFFRMFQNDTTDSPATKSATVVLHKKKSPSSARGCNEFKCWYNYILTVFCIIISIREL